MTKKSLASKIFKITCEVAKAVGKALWIFSKYLVKYFIIACRYPLFTVPLLGALSGYFLYVFHGTDYATFFMVTIIAWLASDILTPFILRGGNGIFQFRLAGTHTMPEGYGFLTFFGVILLITLVINVLSDKTTQMLSDYLGNPLIAFSIGCLLSLFVFLDLVAKFYKHEKQQK